MKKVILMTFVLAVVLTSCSSNSKKVDAKDAVKVEVVKDEATNTFNIVSEGSHVTWRATHLGGLQPRYGKIFAQSVEVLVNDGKVSNANLVFDMNTFTVENFEDEESINKLTGHLKNEDFFKVDMFPTSKFELTKVEASEGDFNSSVTGNLTILDATKSITFNANINATDNSITVKSEKFSVNREDWGLVYNKEGTVGVPTNYIISKGIDFTIDFTVSK